MWGGNQIFYFYSSSLGCHKTETQQNSTEKSWVAQVCEAVSWDTQQIRALFNPLEISSGRMSSWIHCSCPESWRQDADAEMIQTFLWML